MGHPLGRHGKGACDLQRDVPYMQAREQRQSQDKTSLWRRFRAGRSTICEGGRCMHRGAGRLTWLEIAGLGGERQAHEADAAAGKDAGVPARKQGPCPMSCRMRPHCSSKR